MLVEIAANNISSAFAAWQGGADRVELCDNLSEGGTTPSRGTIQVALAQVQIPIFPIIRARGGDFLYTSFEKEAMLNDIALCADLGCPGIVIGALDAKGDIDISFCKQMIAQAKNMQITFHRAFDRTQDAFSALQQIIDLGCTRVLTSGQAPDAFAGIDVLTTLQLKFGDQIIIMPGAGVTANNVNNIITQVKAKEVHASMKHLETSKMNFKAKNFSNETYINTAIEKVTEFVQACKAI
jgi:copper homeostasis protein